MLLYITHYDIRADYHASKANFIPHFYAKYSRIPPNVLFRRPILNRHNTDIMHRLTKLKTPIYAKAPQRSAMIINRWKLVLHSITIFVQRYNTVVWKTAFLYKEIEDDNCHFV